MTEIIAYKLWPVVYGWSGCVCGENIGLKSGWIGQHLCIEKSAD